MPKSKLLKLAEKWQPNPDDPHGEDKHRLISYLLKTNRSAANPVTLTKLLNVVPFKTINHREGLQHQLLGPLRRDPNVFVGTSNAGVFLRTDSRGR